MLFSTCIYLPAVKTCRVVVLIWILFLSIIYWWTGGNKTCELVEYRFDYIVMSLVTSMFASTYYLLCLYLQVRVLATWIWLHSSIMDMSRHHISSFWYMDWNLDFMIKHVFRALLSWQLKLLGWRMLLPSFVFYPYHSLWCTGLWCFLESSNHATLNLYCHLALFQYCILIFIPECLLVFICTKLLVCELP